MRSPITIAFLTASVSSNAGGVSEAIRHLALGQNALKCSSIRIFGLEDSCDSRKLPGWQSLRLTTHGVLGPRAFGYAPELLRSLAVAQPDLLHQHGIWMYPSVACHRWSMRTGKPYIVSPHGMLDPWALGKSNWKKRLAGSLYEYGNLQGATCLHAVSESEARAIRLYGLKKPICIIPNGIDPPPNLEILPPAWEDGVTRGAKVVLYLGRLHPKKNLLNLLRAWADVRRSTPASHEWRLVIAGWDEGGYAKELERAALELEIQDVVRFPGPQFGDAKHATFRRSDAFILPSLSEGLPVAVLEAWAYGLPVLMTPECNLPEGFQAGAALHLGPGLKSIAACLVDLMEMSAENRTAMGEHGQRLVRDKFSWSRIAQQMRGVYNWCLGAGEKPGCMSN
jgi:glycosyltransferase involved in cell wall biosynthesis